MTRTLATRAMTIALAAIALISPDFNGAPSARAQQKTTAVYDDWTVLCDLTGGKKVCESAHQVYAEDGGALLGQITVGRRIGGGPFEIKLQTPSNISVDAGAKLTCGVEPIVAKATFNWCLPNRCLATASIPDDAMAKLRGATEACRVEYKQANEQDLRLSISVKGLAQAVNASEK